MKGYSNMIKGGYKIVDFQDTNITPEQGITVVGIYETIESSHRKPLLISGLTISGVEKNDCFVSCTAAENSYSFTAYGYTFTITNEDAVSIAAA